jgi:hypothetical protein
MGLASSWQHWAQVKDAENFSELLRHGPRAALNDGSPLSPDGGTCRAVQSD